MDLSYLLWLQELRTGMGGALDGLFEQISYFVISPYMFALLGVVCWCVSAKGGAWMLMNVTVADFVNNVVKLTACIYRPWVRDPRIVPAGDAITTATGYSVPSGHSTLATAEFGSLAVWQRRRKWVVALCCIAVALVLFSRNYLGVHTPQDVVVGCGLCSVVIFCNSRVWRWLEGGANRDWIAVGVALGAGVIAMVYIVLKPYPMDYTAAGTLLVDPVKMQPDAFAGVGRMWGFWLGFSLHRHFLPEEVEGSLPVRAVRAVVGVAGLLGINLLNHPLKAAVGALAGPLVWNFLLFFYILFLYPLIFNAVERRLKSNVK